MIGLLIPLLRVPDSFVATAEVLMDILTKSSMQDGKGGKILTEPLLDFIVAVGPTIVQESLSSKFLFTLLSHLLANTYPSGRGRWDISCILQTPYGARGTLYSIPSPAYSWVSCSNTSADGLALLWVSRLVWCRRRRERSTFFVTY